MPNPKPRGSFNSAEALPVRPAEITADWLSKALGRPIKAVTIVGEIHGTASKILLEIKEEESEPTAGGGGAPPPETPHHQRICLKGGFNPELVAIHPGLNATYRREAEFYYHVAPLVEMRLPRAWYCGSDAVSGQGLVAMADLSAEGCTFGTPLAAWPAARVRAGVEQLAALHAATWGATPARFPWLAGDNSSSALGESPNPLRGMILALLSPAAWAVRFDAPGARPPVPEASGLADRARLEAAFRKLWRTTDPRFACVIHGDAHVGNTYVTAAGEPGFVDWQGLHIGSPFHDVSYFVIGALDVEDRRRNELALFDHYLAALAAKGGPELRRDEVWDEYRKHVLHGIAWALSAPQMQPNDVVFAMVRRHVAAVEDHGSLALLESLPE
ncbi:hypothetical protein SLS62_008463 [Diatrype stigma]|uniref:CHK kinase-like domain-containing protein n=1 Tax=Diatrype stigma TaxID=117547 RepID=A0AAN9UKE5_9PEZI